MDAPRASTLAKLRPRNPVDIHPLTVAAPGEGLADALRKLWRQRRMIAALTVLLSGLAATVAWSIPSTYSAEARVLVDVHSPRMFGADAIVADGGLDADRVQNESFELQSRTLAKLVIDKLQLADNAAFNPELRQPSFWTLSFGLGHLLPDAAWEWLDQRRAKPAAPVTQQPDRLLGPRDNRLIDLLLSKIDVSVLGRSHVLSVTAEARDPALAASIANTLAEIYLDGQRRERAAAMERIDRFLTGRVAELREQVRKSDQAIEDYRRSHRRSGTSSAGPSGATERLVTERGTPLVAANDRSIELEALERDAAINRRLHEAMLDRARQGPATDERLQVNARLVSPAAPPESPANPPRPLLAFLGATGGVLLACGIALLREGADWTFRRADQVETITGLPVLAMVPEVPTRTPPSMQVLRQPASTYGEALRRLQIGIETSSAAAAPRTVLFTSATASEGKSVMVSSLARLMASNGRRILVIDCDRRSPSQHRIFRCPLGVGLAGLLADKAIALDDTLHHDAVSGVDVLTAGTWSPRQAHLLTSPHMRQLLDALAPLYDHVLLDSAPVLATADVMALSRLVEKVVFVVRWAHTRQGAAVEALRQIVEAQGDVAGVVLSRVSSRQYGQPGHRHEFYEHSVV